MYATETKARLAHVIPRAVTFLTPFEASAEIELTPDGRVVASDRYRICEWEGVETTTEEPVAFHPQGLEALRSLSHLARMTLHVSVEGELSARWEVGRREETRSALLYAPRYSDRIGRAREILEDAEGWRRWPLIHSQQVLCALETARRHRIERVKLSVDGAEMAVELYPPSGWEGRFRTTFRKDFESESGSVSVRADFAYWCMKAIGGSWRVPPPDGALILVSERPLAILAGSQAM